jgi:hypothetical protein
VGARGAHAARQALHQHRGPGRGGQRRGIPKRHALCGHRRAGAPAVRGHILQTRRQRHAGTGKGGGGGGGVPGMYRFKDYLEYY